MACPLLLDVQRARYSITASTKARSAGGISRPSALAVFKLIRRLKLVGCSIGKSAGVAGVPYRDGRFVREVREGKKPAFSDGFRLAGAPGFEPGNGGIKIPVSPFRSTIILKNPRISSHEALAQQPAEHLAGRVALELGAKFDGAILALRGSGQQHQLGYR